MKGFHDRNYESDEYQINNRTYGQHGKLLSKPKLTVTKTRAEALQDVQSFLSIDDMTDIVNSDGVFSAFTKDFNQLYYNDQGGVGLGAFILKITKR